MKYYSIFQNNIAPFLYIYSDKEELLETGWIIEKKNLQKVILKKWLFFEDQLNKYFNNNLKTFEIRYKIDNLNEFSIDVLNTLKNIPYGKILNYKKIAEMVDKPKSSRSIGQICKKNKLPLIIPCHRVVSKNGIGGYSGKISLDSIEIQIKKKLLKLEGVNLGYL